VSRNPRSNTDIAGWRVALSVLVALAPWTTGAAAAFPRVTDGHAAPPRAQVICVKDARATRAFQPDAARVRAMLDRAVTTLTGQADVAAAWRSLVSSQDVVGLKVVSSLGPISGTRPALVSAVIEGLLAAGLPAANIVIWDRDIADLRHAGFPELAARYGVRVQSSVQAGFDPQSFYDTPLLGSLIWGDTDFGKKDEGAGRRSYFSKLVSRELTKIVNIPPLLTHPVAGVSGNLYGLAVSSTDNTWRFEGDPGRLAQAVPEIYALPPLSERVVLNIVDALLCQYQGSQRGMLHYSTVLNEIRVSRDPVALDVLSLKELDRQRALMDVRTGKANLELYQNAALLELGISDLDRIEMKTFQ
jgi:uncharacterized protein (DUF362 family)